MIGQGIQEKTGTPARCAHRRGKTQAVTAKCSHTPAHFTTKKGSVFPFRRELFTFSTGFSTVFVKKKGSFPCGFPLFPPGFPQCKCSRCIHGVILRQGVWDVLGEKEGVSPFIKKKVEAFSFHFTVRCGVPVFGSPIWNERGQSFQHRGGCKPRLWKMRGKAQFSTPPFPGAEKAEILPFSVRCARIRTAEIGRFTRRMGDFAA